MRKLPTTYRARPVQPQGTIFVKKWRVGPRTEPHPYLYAGMAPGW